ncbi:MAG: MdtA/MuxA family multidrug efflux RND transporter periplasmic adaptor subunit [Methylomonas sp.]|jgi:multidrug efflux system membrane fusion protein|uniref:MdtA/MuxA family multidrug efflux RND transporter periplasmic adaptor subunit n=1 Tax=Methylomonas sp. TaxID=418 RepID=UPI0025F47805|nr:MdtA/MuxA family multidrug efflux RND transporter periplasmic adaptor subunit [Methylomonas sp.]MCK9608460.1 MdtA/MuxA family multidrug efflux RND transporter periplasmic adaptor subunit [Methylomonas sp.]
MNPDFDPRSAKSKPGKIGSPGWQWPVILLLMVAAGGYVIWRSDHAGTASEDARAKRREQNPVAVSVASVTQGDMPIFLDGLGTVTPLRTVTLHSRVDGELIRVAFSEGQQVKQGDLLAEIDPRAFQVQLQQAQGQLLHDQALLKNAEIDLARYRTLLEQDSIAGQQVATQEALVEQYRGTVEVDRAQVENAKLQLSYTKITAPINGRVGLRLVDQGNLVHANDSNGLVVITQLQPITVVFTLPEDRVQAVMQRWHAAGTLPIEAYDRAGQQKLAGGKLLALDNQIDPTTGTFKLKAQFENADQTLFPNQFVNIKMKLNNLPAATLVPTAAIQQGAIGSFVYVVNDDNTVTVRAVRLGPGMAETVAVLEGLTPRQKVVVDGADKLREGSRVKVIPGDELPIANENPTHRQAPS